LSAPDVPFTATVLAFAPHARLVPRGPGLEPEAVPVPPPRGPEERHHPAVRLALAGSPAGPREVVVSTALPEARVIYAGGRAWSIGFRPRAEPQPWTLTLESFAREWHEGTRIERSSQARLRLRPAGAGEDREVVVTPNAPLRHAGFTFYLDGPDPAGRGVILRVVRDPAGGIPYAAGALLAVGLLLTAVGRLRRAAPPRPAPAAPPRRAGAIVFCVLLGVGVFGAWSLRPTAAPGGFDLTAWGSLPVLDHGREKPLDTVARSTLLRLQGRPSWGGLGREPVERLLDVLYQPERAEHSPVFAVTHPELRGLLGLPPQGETRQALAAFRDRLPDLEAAARRAAEVPRAERTAFEDAVLRLRDGVRWHRGLTASASVPGPPGWLDELTRPGALARDASASPAAASNSQAPALMASTLAPAELIRQPAGGLRQLLGQKAIGRPWALFQVLAELLRQPKWFLGALATPGMGPATIAPAAGVHHPGHGLLEPAELVLHRALVAEIAIHRRTQGNALRQAEADHLHQRQIQARQCLPQR
jgi:hypothetical protein